MKKHGLVISSIFMSGALLLSGCTSGVGGAKDGLQPSTNGQSTENPDALPSSYDNLGGAKGVNLDGSGHSATDETESPVLTPTPVADPSGVPDINAPSEIEQIQEIPGGAPEVDDVAVAGFEGAKTFGSPSDSITELKPREPFIVNSNGFKPNTLVYAHLYYKDAEGNGDVITNGVSDDKGNVSIRGYVPAGFSSDANYIVRIAGVNNEDKGVFSQAPIRIVK